jgi:hypothetical protein
MLVVLMVVLTDNRLTEDRWPLKNQKENIKHYIVDYLDQVKAT